MRAEEYERRQTELVRVLDRLGWSAGDLYRFLFSLRVDADLHTVESWLSLKASEAVMMIPRWPALLVGARFLPASALELEHFKAAEFGLWGQRCAPQLLAGLDLFRAVLGQPVMISPAPGALGRRAGRDSSLHNVDKYGLVYAADVMLPAGPKIRAAFEVARWCRVFSGVGIYPDWRPHPGLHVDVRHASGQNPTPGADTINPATWVGVRGADGRQRYVSVDAIMET